MKPQWTWRSALLGGALLAGACASHEAACPAAGVNPASQIWHAKIDPEDNDRLRKWRDSWVKALADARSAGFGAQIDAEGSLLDPDAALPLKPPPPGIYSCRTIKIGAQPPSTLHYVPYPAFNCRISREGNMLRFAKLTGPQRQIGVLLPQTDKRMVLLGTMQLGDETNILAYDRDQERDVAALLEMIGDERWRLVFPSPHFESLTDVMELVPKRTASR
jgi:uncharacterized protein DUF4893